MGIFEKRLVELGYRLPPAPEPKGSYLPYQWSNGILHVSGQISIAADGRSLTGSVGHDRSVEEGVEAARLAALNTLATIGKAIGNLDNIKRFVFLNGFVQAVAGFAESPRVINGASDLLVEIFGEKGRHARAAVAVAGLPLNCTVEIQVSLEVK